jgi:hypothetical protein
MANEWKVVKTKNSLRKKQNLSNPRRQQDDRKRQHANPLVFTLSSEGDVNNNLISVEEYLNRFSNIRELIIQTKVYCHCVDVLQTLSLQNFSQIVLLGIGHFIKSSSACLQLALGLELFRNHPNFHIYDPILSSQEIEICQSLNLKVNCFSSSSSSSSITGVDSLHEALGGEGATFFYMPHCPYSLYNKILWSNWGDNLRQIVILGNSFQSYSLRRLVNVSRSDCMNLLQEVTEEIEVWKNEFRSDELLKRCASYHELYSLENAFNDTRSYLLFTSLSCYLVITTSLLLLLFLFSLMHFTKELSEQRKESILRIENRPTEEDMQADLENDLELIRQEVR